LEKNVVPERVHLATMIPVHWVIRIWI
jgi:hypothetical protein